MAAKTGRPRDDSIDQRALAAATELLVESGFEGTNMQSIAKRAGLHVSALYRRWPSRIELIEDAIFPGLARPSVAPTGDLVTDLRRFVRAYAAALGSSAARAAIPGLLAHHQSAGAPPAEHYLHSSARPQFNDILAAAPAGSIALEVDPDDAFDIVFGALLARSIVPNVAARDRPLERTVELLIRMLQPTVAASRLRSSR